MHLCLASHDDEGDALLVGILHLFLHLAGVRVDFATDALLTKVGKDGQRIGCLFLTKVDEEYLRGGCYSFGIEVKLVQDIIDTVSTKANANTAQAGHTEDASQVVVTSATSNRTNLHIQGLHLENATGIVVQATSKRQVKRNQTL